MFAAFSLEMDEQFVDALWRMARAHPELVTEATFETTKLDKMTAARRQLNTAIWLWFRGGDLGSVHTLTGAAFGILDGLYFSRFKRRPVPFDDAQLPEYLRPHAKKLRNLLAKPQDFLKHARHDGDASHDLSAQWTENYIYNAIKAFWDLNDGKMDQTLMFIFIVRFSAIYPHIFGGIDKVAPTDQKRREVEEIKQLSPVEYFDRVGGQLRLSPPIEK